MRLSDYQFANLLINAICAEELWHPAVLRAAERTRSTVDSIPGRGKLSGTIQACGEIGTASAEVGATVSLTPLEYLPGGSLFFQRFPFPNRNLLDVFKPIVLGSLSLPYDDQSPDSKAE
jgi:hypothetical protein